MKNVYIKYVWLGVLVAAIPAVWALFVPGFFGVSDDLHVAWLQQFDKTLRLGQIPPRFVPDLSYGYGYPLFNFVFPFPFYIGALLHTLGFNFVDSIKGVFLLSMLASGFSMYRLLRYYASKLVSLAAAVVYMYTPYRATDMYGRGAIGEIVSFALLPLLILVTVKLTGNTDEKWNWRWINIGAFVLAAQILSHNIAIYMFFPFMLLLGLMQVVFVTGNRIRATIQFCITIALGLLASMYFWLPALLDTKYMQYDTVFNFWDHFPTIRQLITPYWGYGASVPGPYDGLSFFIGHLNLVSLVGGALCLFLFRKKLSKTQITFMVWAGVTFAAAFVMMNYRSSFLWHNLPLIAYFQFPWRFLIITTLVTPLFLVSVEWFKWKWVIALVVIASSLVFNAPHFRPQDFLGRTDDYYFNRYIPVPVASEEYNQTQEEYLRLTKYTKERPKANAPLVTPAEVALVTSTDGLSTSLTTHAEQPFTLYYAKYWFPGWEASIDGKPVRISPGSTHGEITFDVPSGTHDITIRFSETPLKSLLDGISLVTIFVCLFGIWSNKLRSLGKAPGLTKSS